MEILGILFITNINSHYPYHINDVSKKAKKSGTVIDSYLTDKGNNIIHLFHYHFNTILIGISPSVKKVIF